MESDVYMFSITMWEMLERDVPYRGTPVLQIPELVWKVNCVCVLGSRDDL